MKVFYPLVCAALLALSGMTFASEVNLDQRIDTSVTSSSGTGVYIKSENSDGELVLKKIYDLPKDTKLSFRPISTIERPLVLRDSGKVVTSAGRYFGKVVIERDGFNRREWKEVQEINKKEIYVYEWSLDKDEYLKALFDKPIENKMERFDYKESFSWDKISTKGLWTSTAAQIIKSTGRDLLDNTPEDVTDFCPKYFELEEKGKVAFWIHLLNSIAKRESAFDLLVGNDESNFGDSGNQVVSRGALQISYDSSKARVYRNSGCDAKSADDLHNFETNITCGIAIFSHWSREDGCISCKNAQGKARGIARYWSTLRERYEVPCKICSSGVAKVGYKEQIIDEIKSTPTCRGK